MPSGFPTVPGGGGSGSGVTAVTASPPLASSGGATPDISLTGQVALSKGGTAADLSAASDGVVIKSGSAMATTTAPAMSGANINDGTVRLDSLAAQGASTNAILRWNGTNWGISATASANLLLTSGASAPGWSNILNGIVFDAAVNSLSNVGTSMLATSFNLAATQGGTGQTSYTVGDLLYASTTTALSKLAASTSGYVLTANGAGVAPSWQAPSVATNSTSSLSSSQYNISATDTYEDIGLSVTLPAAGTYRVWVNLTVGGRITANPNGLITFKLYNSTDAADVSNSERTAPWITQNSVGIVDNVAFEETIPVAASKTIKVYAKKNSGPTWTDAYISSATDGRSRIGYVKY